MPISTQQKEWLERFCKKNRYQLDTELSDDGIVTYKKPIGTNMIAVIACGDGYFGTRFMLVAGRQLFKGVQSIPWSLIGEGVNGLKLQLMAGMSAAWDQVFNQVTGCGLDELKKIE